MSLQGHQPLPISRAEGRVLPDSALALPQALTPSHSAAVRVAASTMTGAKRRAFEAAMTWQYGAGHPLQAATTWGWSRRPGALGVAASRPGLLCLGAPSAGRGRQRWAERPPQVAEARRHLAAAHAPHAPPWRTSLGFRRRHVLTAQPPKQRTETNALGDHLEKKTRKRRPRTASNACAWLGKRPSTAARSRVGASRGALLRRARTIGAGRSKTCRAGSWLKSMGRGA
jgi:hypothetical protein